MNKDIIAALFESGASILDAGELYIQVDGTLRQEFRGPRFEHEHTGTFEIDLSSMILRLYGDENNILASAPIKISLDHTCTNPLTA